MAQIIRANAGATTRVKYAWLLLPRWDHAMHGSQHAAVAPKYATAEDCQSDFGAEKCEIAPYRTASGGSVFMPMMAGYMMGSMLGGRGSMMSQPLYRSNQGTQGFRTAENRGVGSTTGRTKVASSATNRPSFKSSTRSRGGFGSSSRRFGSSAT